MKITPLWRQDMSILCSIPSMTCITIQIHPLLHLWIRQYFNPFDDKSILPNYSDIGYFIKTIASTLIENILVDEALSKHSNRRSLYFSTSRWCNQKRNVNSTMDWISRPTTSQDQMLGCWRDLCSIVKMSFEIFWDDPARIPSNQYNLYLSGELRNIILSFECSWQGFISSSFCWFSKNF